MPMAGMNPPSTPGGSYLVAQGCEQPPGSMRPASKNSAKAFALAGNAVLGNQRNNPP